MLGKQLPIPAVASPNVSKQNNRFTCICCRIKFDSSELQRTHFKTEWHLYNLKRRVCDLAPIDLTEFEQIQAQRTQSVDHSQIPIDLDEHPGYDEDDDDDDEDWEVVDEDYEEDELDGLLDQVISNDTCLFCDKHSSTIANNLQHMDEVHGFFIPERCYLIDLEGLLEYLGFKVGVGSSCLWCNKQLTSKHGARLHMINKDHCKIFYDQERAVTEFKEFYDYSSQETFEMKSQVLFRLPRSVDRRARQSCAVVKASQSKRGESGALVETSRTKALRSLEKKSIKKFDAYRAKIALRTMVKGNNFLRSRLRAQNPI